MVYQPPTAFMDIFFFYCISTNKGFHQLHWRRWNFFHHLAKCHNNIRHKSTPTINPRVPSRAFISVRPTSFFCPFFFFHLIGQRASRDISLSAFNWSNGKRIIYILKFVFVEKLRMLTMHFPYQLFICLMGSAGITWFILM